MRKNSEEKPSLFIWIFRIFGILLFALALFSIIVLASHMRLSGDDYCYNAVLSEKGFWKMQPYSYFHVATYNGNRYSLTLFSGIFGLFPRWGNSILVTSALIVWVFGAKWIIDRIFNLVNFHLHKVDSLIISLVFVSLIIWSTPNIEQSILWRSGMLPYFMPIIGIMWLTITIIKIDRSVKHNFGRFFEVFFVALTFGGFSETGTALMGGLLFLLVIFFSTTLFMGRENYRKYLYTLVFAILGTISALLLLYFSPTTRMRFVNMPETLALGNLIRLLGWNIKVFFWQALFRRTLTTVMPLIFGFSLGLIYLSSLQNNRDQNNPFKDWLFNVKSLILISLSSIFLVGCVMLPSTFVFSDYPPQRALILAQVILTSSLIMGGTLFCFLINSILILKFNINYLQKNHHKWLVLVFLLVISLVPINLISSSWKNLDFYSKWSNHWDKRHQILLTAGKNNVDEIQVTQLDHIISDVGDLSPDSSYWYNNCAEDFYGVNEIYADQPGW